VKYEEKKIKMGGFGASWRVVIHGQSAVHRFPSRRLESLSVVRSGCGRGREFVGVYVRVRRLQRLNQLLDVHRLGEEVIPDHKADGQTSAEWRHGRRQRRVSQAASRQSLNQPAAARATS
jgi:hypothetical protein